MDLVVVVGERAALENLDESEKKKKRLREKRESWGKREQKQRKGERKGENERLLLLLCF